MPEENQFTAVVLEQADGKITSAIKTLDDSALPDGDVTVAVSYSALNYKDGMVMNGIGRLVRSYPHVPGIDFSGKVLTSTSAEYKPGDEVVLTGWRVGETHWGGYATKARVKSDWLVPLPDGLSAKQAAAVGTAGLTAMLSVMALEEAGIGPDSEGGVLVTGASGGVGSLAVTILANLGYHVIAGTGRAENEAYLKDLGAAEIVSREELEVPPKGPLGGERWAGAIDNVGGTTLSHILSTLCHGGACASVGLTAGADLKTTVLPFLLRGIRLQGIDSTLCPKDRRVTAWKRLAGELPFEKIDAVTHVEPLARVVELGGKILQGQIRGRTVIDVGA